MSGSPALYYNTLPFGSVAAEGFHDLVGAARHVMEQAGMTDLRTGATWAAGRTANSHAAIGFVGGTSASTNAVVMVAGDDAHVVLGTLMTGLQNVKFL